MRHKLTLLALSLGTALSAQIDLKSVRYGLTAGYNYSRVRNAHNPSGARNTFQGGALALIQVGRDDQFYVQPEVVYYGGGETSGNQITPKAVYANSYISVPIYFKAYLSEAPSEFFAMVGPRFNFLINQKTTNVPKERPYYGTEDLPQFPGVNGKANPFSMMLGGGFGYSYNRNIELSVRADVGLSNIYKNLMNEPGSDPAIKKNKRENVISVNLAYIFDR